MTTDIDRRAIAQIFVRVNGAAISDGMLGDLIETIVESTVHLPDMASMTFADADFEWSDASRLDVGDELVIAIGSNELQREVFVGEVTALELSHDIAGLSFLVVRAYDRAYRLHRGRKTRVFKQMSDADIARQVARDLHMTAEIESTRPVHDYVLQDNRTDWEFLADRAQRNGLEMQVQGRALVFKVPPSAPAETVELRNGDNLLAFRAQLAASEQVGEVEVRGWDPIAKRAIVGTASRGESTTAVSERSRGGELAGRSFNDSPRVVIAREHVATQAQAEVLAQAALDELEQALITAEGEAIGDPRLRLGSELRIEHVGARFSGSYYVTSVTHVYGQDGYRNLFQVSGRRPTDLFSLLAQPAASSRGFQLLTGVVTNNSDDRDRGRVKVRLPALGDDVESHWCRVLAPGAGAERGIEFLPEIDDEVLVLGSDVNELFVLGGLWNQEDRPPEVTSSAISGGAVEHRIIRSRSGHTILFDDSSSTPGITVVDSTGSNRVFIDTQSNSIAIEADADISIVARGSLEIRAERDLTLEAGTELKLSSRTGATSVEAGTQLALKGNATAALEGGARAEVKAPSVSIGP